jgi:hypothetical protein
MLASGRPHLLHVGACAHTLSCAAPCAAPFHLDLRPQGFLHLPLAPHPHPRACRQVQQLQQAATADGSHYNMCNTRSTFAISKGNMCNIRLKQLKHLQHTSETRGKHMCSHCKTYVTLHIMCETYTTSEWNTCNISVKHMQHSHKTRSTYIWNNWNI